MNQKKPRCKEEEKTLHGVLTLLQKSFSRVSEDAAGVPENEPLAMIMGGVDFEMSVKVSPEDDFLRVHPEGSITLNLRGTIQTDVRETATEENS